MPTTDIPREQGTPRPGPLTATDPRLDAWRAFLEAHARVFRRLDEELRTEHGLSVAEYDALLQLATAPGRRLRMNQLADRVILSRSGITRLIDRLEADGLVGRAQCSSDARGAEALLTDAGLERLRVASRTHLRGIDEHFLSIVASDDLEAIGRALGEVASRACPGAGAGARSEVDRAEAAIGAHPTGETPTDRSADRRLA